MTILIDLIGSVIVAGYVIFLGLRINFTMSDNAVATSANVNLQEAMVDIVNTMESDWKKIGFGLTDPTLAIAYADSQKIKFLADMDRNGTPDTVEWYVSNPVLKITGGGIKRDTLTVRNLYRKYNGGAALLAAVNVTQFNLKYLDQDGTQTSTLSQMTMIESTIAISSPYKIIDQVNPDQTAYASTIWRQGRCSTRNIKRHG
jgi:hypothetical protein